VKLLICACIGCGIGALGVALADDPPPAPTNAPSATASAAPTAAAATPSSPTVVVTGKRSADERRLIMAGWHEEMHNGEKVFCRWEDETGSRLERKHVCGSVDQIKDAVQQTDDRLTESLRHAHYLSGH
jgi:hypothetical protein